MLILAQTISSCRLYMLPVSTSLDIYGLHLVVERSYIIYISFAADCLHHNVFRVSRQLKKFIVSSICLLTFHVNSMMLCFWYIRVCTQNFKYFINELCNKVSHNTNNTYTRIIINSRNIDIRHSANIL